MGSLGETLKTAREKKGLNLKEVADKTRINHSFLKALEEEVFSIIPGEVFVTGFLKTYARELGLDEKDVMTLYREMRQPLSPVPQPAPGNPAEPKPAPALLKPLEAVQGRKTPLYIIILAGLLLGAALTAAILLMTRAEKPAAVKAPPEKPASAPASAPLKPISTAAPLFEIKTSLWTR